MALKPGSIATDPLNRQVKIVRLDGFDAIVRISDPSGKSGLDGVMVRYPQSSLKEVNKKTRKTKDNAHQGDQSM